MPPRVGVSKRILAPRLGNGIPLSFIFSLGANNLLVGKRLLAPRVGASKSKAEMSSDSRESLDHRDPPLFFESRYQSRYQDRDLKSLDSSLDIKTQDLIVSIPVSISRLKFQKS